MANRTMPELVSILRAEGLPGSSLVVINHSTKPVRTFHEWFAFGAVWGGRRQFRCRGKTHQAAPGAFLAWEPGDYHATFGSCEGAMTQRVFLLNPTIFQERAKECGARRERLHLRSNLFRDPAAFKAATRLSRAVECGAEPLETETLLLRFIRLCVGRFMEDSPPEPSSPRERVAVRRIRDRLIDAYDRNVSLGELSSLTGLDRFHLLRVFRRETGVPPHQFQIDVRLAKARAFLEQGRGAAETAALTGFSDQSHFIRQFKRFAGLTPSRWINGRAACSGDFIDRRFLSCPSPT